MKGTVAGVTTVYVGDYYEWTGSTATARRYYYAGGQRIAERVGDSALYFLLGDHLGSTSITANTSGGFVAEVRYMPWGETRYATGTTPTTLRYTGQRQESGLGGANGLYDYGARWLDPHVGRWIQADSIVPEPGNPQALNRYSYSFNNPVNYVDPDGHCGVLVGYLLGLASLSCPAAADNPLDIFVPVPADNPFLINAPAAQDDPTEIYVPEPGDSSAEIFVPMLPEPIGGGFEPLPPETGVLWSRNDDGFGSTLRPGPFAGDSIAARGPERDWTDEEIQEMNRIGMCHTCGATDPGTKSGNFIPDHQPPSKLNFDNSPQRLYPHCINCMRRQGGEVLQRLRMLREDDGG